MEPEARAAVDIGGTTTKVAVVSGDGAVTNLSTMETAGPADRFITALASALAALPAGGGVGVAVAGFVNDQRSAMIYNPNLAWLEGFPLQRALEDRLQRAVTLEADSNAACLAEHRFGRGRGVRRFLCVTLGTGVGGGMLLDGVVVRLAHGGIGDMGHVIVEPFGAGCGSGCRGCAEALISVSGVERRDGRGRSVREIVEAARADEGAAIVVLAKTGTLLGVALASHAVLLFPEVIAVAGGIAEAGEFLLEPARATVEQSIGPFYRRGLRIEKAALGWQAPLVGAAVPWLNR